jgi:hypothetical protein
VVPAGGTDEHVSGGTFAAKTAGEVVYATGLDSAWESEVCHLVEIAQHAIGSEIANEACARAGVPAALAASLGWGYIALETVAALEPDALPVPLLPGILVPLFGPAGNVAAMVLRGASDAALLLPPPGWSDLWYVSPPTLSGTAMIVTNMVDAAVLRCAAVDADIIVARDAVAAAAQADTLRHYSAVWAASLLIDPDDGTIVQFSRLRSVAREVGPLTRGAARQVLAASRRWASISPPLHASWDLEVLQRGEATLDAEEHHVDV